MPQPSYPADPRPRRRPEPTHPPRLTRRGSGRATPTRPGHHPHRRHPSAISRHPAPTTVWTCGPAPIDPGLLWPTPIVSKIVTSFTDPGARVVLLAGPPSPARVAPSPDTPDQSAPTPTDSGSPTTPPGPPFDGDRSDGSDTARAVIAELRRNPRVVPLHPDTPPGPAAAGPSWTGPLGAARSNDTEPTRTPQGDHTGPTRADLVIASVRPEHTGPTADHLARVAARLLRTGGILAVLTHSDRVGSELVDPTGVLVTAAQNNDLLYLQHIVALHTPLRDGHLDTTDLITHHHPARPDDPASAPARPSAHHRVHRDLVIFAQPNDLHPAPTDTQPGQTHR
jgi:hypothetical protein